jgi:hypothetical protein
MMQNIHELPKDLPVPVDDGACDHLPGIALPSVALPSTGDRTVNPAQIPGWLVIYCYPMTGRPDQILPDGWGIKSPALEVARRKLALLAIITMSWRR